MVVGSSWKEGWAWSSTGGAPSLRALLLLQSLGMGLEGSWGAGGFNFSATTAVSSSHWISRGQGLRTSPTPQPEPPELARIWCRLLTAALQSGRPTMLLSILPLCTPRARQLIGKSFF